MLRQRLIGSHYNNSETTPQRSHYDSNLTNDNQPIFSERKIALTALILSISIIFIKIYYLYNDDLHDLITERKLISYEVLTEQGDVMLKYMWATTLKFSRFWLPLVCGSLTTYFTWLMVYLDSSQPGIQPPSPFSPTKYKQKSGHSFHLNYIFAILIGTVVTLYMYWRGISI